MHILQSIDWNVQPQIINFGSFEIRWYSLLFGLGFIIGYYILARIFKKENIKLELLDKLTMYVILATIFGARIGHCLFYEPEVYLKAPLKMILPFTGTIGEDFRFTGFQGLASHGGVIGLLIGLYMYARKFKRPYLWVLDRMAIVAALASAFIRLGNLFNSEIYGVETDLPWGFRFLQEAERYPRIAVENIVPKHPTQIYEALCYLLIFAVLIYFYNKKLPKLKEGFFVGLMMVGIFASRFFIEFVKEDQVDFEQGMSLNMGQWLSIPFVIVGFWLLLRKAKPALESAQD